MGIDIYPVMPIRWGSDSRTLGDWCLRLASGVFVWLEVSGLETGGPGPLRVIFYSLQLFLEGVELVKGKDLFE